MYKREKKDCNESKDKLNPLFQLFVFILMMKCRSFITYIEIQSQCCVPPSVSRIHKH